MHFHIKHTRSFSTIRSNLHTFTWGFGLMATATNSVTESKHAKPTEKGFSIFAFYFDF